MAQLPYGQGVPRVEPEVSAGDRYQNIPTTPAMFGGAVAQGLQAFGQGALKAAHFYDEVSADDATNQYMEGSRKILYGDPDKPWIVDGSRSPIAGFSGCRATRPCAPLPKCRRA